MSHERLPIKRLGEVVLGKMIQPLPKATTDVAAPYLRAAHVQPEGRIIDVDDKTMWYTSDELARHDLRKDDVVVVEGGAGFGRSAVIPEDRKGWGFQNSIVRIRSDSELACGRFIDYALQSALSSGQIEVACFSATILHFTADKVGAFRIPVPPVDKQRAIADYLDHETAQIDELIAEQQRLTDLLEERRAAVVASVLAGGPDWEETRIKHIAHTTLGKMLDAGRDQRVGDELRPYVRAADVLADGTINLADLNEMPFSANELNRLDLRAHDVLLIEGGATVGRPGYLFSDAPGVSFQKTVNRVRVIYADPRFVYWSLLALYESRYYDSYYGSVSFAHLTGEKLREIPLRLPHVAEQRRIASYIDEQTSMIRALIAEAERFIELACERRSALITAAVTGQIDMRATASVK